MKDSTSPRPPSPQPHLVPDETESKLKPVELPNSDPTSKVLSENPFDQLISNLETNSPTSTPTPPPGTPPGHQYPLSTRKLVESILTNRRVPDDGSPINRPSPMIQVPETVLKSQHDDGSLVNSPVSNLPVSSPTQPPAPPSSPNSPHLKRLPSNVSEGELHHTFSNGLLRQISADYYNLNQTIIQSTREKDQLRELNFHLEQIIDEYKNTAWTLREVLVTGILGTVIGLGVGSSRLYKI